MNWSPKECRAGNIIRVNLGAIYHYGIFVSEAEIIQFGLPPIPQNFLSAEQITVCTSDMDTFSCGKIVEVGVFTKKENKERFSDGEIVRRASARLGEGGYSLLHNNCEHFVYDCAFGKPYCSVEAEAVARWNSRPVLDIYVMPLEENTLKMQFSCEKRMAELKKVSDPVRRREKQGTWTLLELAIDHSFRKKAESLNFRKSLFGKWRTDTLSFSLAHGAGYAVTAVSNRDCGVAFTLSDTPSCKAGIRRKSLYKSRGNCFPASDKVKTVFLKELGMTLSYCGESVNKARFFVLRGDKLQMLNEVIEQQ